MFLGQAFQDGSLALGSTSYHDDRAEDATKRSCSIAAVRLWLIVSMREVSKRLSLACSARVFAFYAGTNSVFQHLLKGL